MPRFVLLYHECPPGYDRPSHWDLMFEAGDVLRTWALTELPQSWRVAQSKTALSYGDCRLVADGDCVAAEKLADHRREYLELEGPLSGNRGSVTRIDAGTFETILVSPQLWRIKLAGKLVSGAVSLSQAASDEGRWTLISGPTD